MSHAQPLFIMCLRSWGAKKVANILLFFMVTAQIQLLTSQAKKNDEDSKE